MKSVRFFLIFFIAALFFSVSFLAALAMHPGDNMNHPSCIALVLNGALCPQGAFWDYFFFHLNALKKIQTFIAIESFNGFALTFILILFSAASFSLILIKALSIFFLNQFSRFNAVCAPNGIRPEKFYRWLSIRQKKEDALVY